MIIVGILLALILSIIVVGVWRGVTADRVKFLGPPEQRPPGVETTLPRKLP